MLKIGYILVSGVFLFYRNHPELNDVEGNQGIFSFNFENITQKSTSLLCGHCGRDTADGTLTLQTDHISDR